MNEIEAELGFRPLVSDDFPMLLDWLGRPHVKEWWNEGEDTLAKVEAAYSPEPDVERFVLLVGQTPSGYFQYYRTGTKGQLGIDQFLAHEADLGRGLGRRAIAAFIEHIRAHQLVERVIVDPDPKNTRAIRCYEHVGFRHTETRPGWNGALAFYMEFDPTDRPRVRAQPDSRLDELEAMVQELRERAEKAESANRTKSLFLASTSHELRSPLNGVIGMAELLLGQELDDDVADMVETIQRSGHSLMALLNDILDFSKIEAGKLKLESIPFNPVSTVTHVADEFATRAHERDLQLIVDCESTVPWQVIGDPVRLRQVLVNLVDNAIKFTKRGHVMIRLRVQGGDPDHSAIRFEVEDTGAGISDQRKNSLFEPFTQAHTSTTREFGGTGLGLSIVKKLLDLMDGEFGVQSTVGQGSTFWFVVTWPIFASRPSSLDQATDLWGVRVLLVDAHSVAPRVLTTYLREHGLQASNAQSSAAALEILRSATTARAPFQLVVMDHRMSDIDGAPLARSIVTDPAIQDPVVLVMTSTPERMETSFSPQTSPGAIHWIARPVHGAALLRTLTRMWSNERARIETSRAPQLGSEPTGNAQTSTARAVVLVVEDNAVNQRVARKLLERLNCRVELVSNGLEAVMAHASGRYDVIFMDCQMPDMDGYDATRAIRARERERRTPIVAMTAHALDGDRERCLNAGMDDYLPKPISTSRLAECLDSWLADHPNHRKHHPTPSPERPIETVLVVDDSRTQRISVIGYLKDQGYRTAEAADGEEALKHAREQRFDALIVDQQMPNMSGLEMIAQVRQLRGYQSVLIVLLTMESPRNAWWELGIDFWMRKSRDYQMLGKILRRWSPTAT